MDEGDALLVRKARALFDQAFPGVLGRLEAMPGRYLPDVPYKHIPAKGARPKVLQLWLKYLVTARGGTHVAMRVTLEQKPDKSWQIVEHRYHIGTNPMADSDSDDDTHFRVCKNSRWPHHFHLRGYEKAADGSGHIPASAAKPPLSEEPAWFIGLVEEFVATNTISIGVNP